jgi:hypothetical protein
VLEIVVDTRERYAWKFDAQQADVTKRALVVGDYGVELDGAVVGVVERERLAELAAEMLAAAQVRYPNVPIVFAETRPLAQEYTYRFLGAALRYAEEEAVEL